MDVGGGVSEGAKLEASGDAPRCKHNEEIRKRWVYLWGCPLAVCTKWEARGQKE